MASIYGVTIKNLKKFMGHESPCFQGNVYLDGKKLGFWSQDSWGGCDNYEFDENILSGAVETYKASDMLPDEYRSIAGTDTLMFEIVELLETQKHFKAAVKKGYSVLTEIKAGVTVTYISSVKELTEEEILEEKKKIGSEKAMVRVFRTPDDFEIR